MHWTYAEPQPDADLQQGDILSATPSLRRLLKEIHPRFGDDKYLAFAVATQTCDLVRRPRVKARYISLSPVRSLREALPRLLEEVAAPVVPGLFRKSSKGKAVQFLERLFDQNEQSSGLFYLHPDAEAGIGEPAIIFLRVKVTLREDHYQLLLQARKGRLAPDFQAKFGWLVGNLYSRAASRDWSDFGATGALKELVRTGLSEQIEGRGPVWVDDELIDAGKTAGMDFSGKDLPALLKELERHRPSPKIELVADRVVQDIAQLLEISDEDRTKLRKRLTHDSKLKKLVK